MEKDVRCDSCIYCLDPNCTNEYKCYRYPPKLYNTKNGLVSLLPDVDPDAFCGEHKE
jgi:hypothetical protein